MIQPNQTLTIKNFHIVPVLRQNGLLINLPQRMLYLFRDGKLKAAYPVGLGKPGWPTPMGDFTVLEKATDKPWVVPESIQEEMRQEGLTVKTQVPPGPDNPLGKYWLGLSIPALGIHGTIAPASVYQFQSHGCIRLHADRIAALYQHVAQGETGSIVYLPILLTTSEGKVFLEVHPDRYHRADISVAAVRRLAQTKKLSDHIDWARAVKIVKQHDGIATEVTRSVGAMD